MRKVTTQIICDSCSKTCDSYFTEPGHEGVETHTCRSCFIIPAPAPNPVESNTEGKGADQSAHKRLMAQFQAIKGRFDSMSEDEYGEWLNSLELDEFLELVALADAG